jgi:hypothetical protein
MAELASCQIEGLPGGWVAKFTSIMGHQDFDSGSVE